MQKLKTPKKQDNKKNRFILPVLVVTIIGVLVTISSLDFFRYNVRRQLSSVNDKFINDIRDKITTLEKEEVKDPLTLRRLAEQYNLLGTIYVERELWTPAIDALNNSLKYGNNSPAVFYSLGLAYSNRSVQMSSADDLDKAEACYRKAIEKKPGFHDSMYGLAVLLFYHRDKKDEAMKLVNEIAAANPAFYEARFAQGRFLYETGKRQQALSVYQSLSADLDKLPPSEIVNQYKSNCSSNIDALTAELSK